MQLRCGGYKERNWIFWLGLWAVVVDGLGLCFSFWNCFWKLALVFSRPICCVYMSIPHRLPVILSNSGWNSWNLLQTDNKLQKFNVLYYLHFPLQELSPAPSWLGDEMIRNHVGLGYVVLPWWRILFIIFILPPPFFLLHLFFLLGIISSGQLGLRVSSL